MWSPSLMSACSVYVMIGRLATTGYTCRPFEADPQRIQTLRHILIRYHISGEYMQKALLVMAYFSTYVAKYLCISSNRPEANDVENVRNFSAIIHARAFSYREGF